MQYLKIHVFKSASFQYAIGTVFSYWIFRISNLDSNYVDVDLLNLIIPCQNTIFDTGLNPCKDGML